MTIETKYLAPTDTKGARIKVTVIASAGGAVGTSSKTIGYDHALSADENHNQAAHSEAVKLAPAKWVRGSAAGGHGYIYLPVGSVGGFEVLAPQQNLNDSAYGKLVSSLEGSLR